MSRYFKARRAVGTSCLAARIAHLVHHLEGRSAAASHAPTVVMVFV
ncbi:hypothetical protein PF001_g517 [Phytophthora fragariae]|uniref:Uncharacterized protein n=1 Tax=Phytophthora fragariae TaxID=53985 RepID=A0A6A4F7N2_9STRA|nr:hypothetical protein PF003_g5492 [Phytophthora fragariae]KAE8949694.1 hypothetical protein PF009_g742 [Phytophthora fragariae]KAE9155611.1 hypothetical protein PF006_g428 [Phytophthora fragariae]KAE9330174.1 hypothetical protein PF001_g517 [Phytophthora fragariae]